MDFTDYAQRSYNLYKKDIFTGFLYGILKSILIIVNAIPIIGTYIYSYYFPRLLVWYYQKVSQEKLTPKYNVSFISLFIPQILQDILIYISFFVIAYFLIAGYKLYFIFNQGTIYNFYTLLSNLSIAYSILLGISFLIYLFSLNSFYGSLLGKVDKYNFEINNSSIIFFNIFSLSLIFGLIEVILSLLFFVNKYFIIIPILLWIFIFTPILDLLPVIVIKDM